MSVGIHISASTSDGMTLDQLGKVIQERMKYMHETARDSIAATAVQVLRSLRTVTKVAKPTKVKVEVKQEGSLYPSFYSIGGKKVFCLRNTATKARHVGNEKIVPCVHGDFPNQKVFAFTDTHSSKLQKYLIVATSISQATQKARSIVARRAMQYSGLAKRALGVLMYKTNTKKVNDGLLSRRVETKANQVTTKREVIAKSADGGKYALILDDALRYALKALKGGRATVEVQMRKAINKVTSVINQKLKNSKDFFSRKKLPTPFPDLKSRKK